MLNKIKILSLFAVGLGVAVLSVFLSGLFAEEKPNKLSSEICYNCHDIKEGFKKSIHGKKGHACFTCHEDEDLKRNNLLEVPHQPNLKPVNCSKCHRLESQIYLQSDHGKSLSSGGINEAATCKDCHGHSHDILNFQDPNSPVNRKNIPETCAKCHDNEEKMKQYKLVQPMPFASYKKSIHGQAVLTNNELYAAICTDCHGSHDLHSHTNPASKIYKSNVPKTCSKCHENVYEIYSKSVHGTAVAADIKEAPVCTDCHGEHMMLSRNNPLSPTYSSNISKETCSRCHESERIMRKYGVPTDVVASYENSYHGLAVQAGSLVTANCSSCHGFHDVLPSNDPRSSINPNNLAKTCGKCHPGAGKGTAKGSVHLRATFHSDKPVYYVTVFYIIVIILTIGGMLLHNSLDLFHKLKEHFKKVTEGIELKERMNTSERVQHIVLLVSFIALAYTGFCHHYPGEWWAYPFSIGQSGLEIRKFLHRSFAAIFMSLSVYHVVWLVLTRRGLKNLKMLLPKLKDLHDFKSMALFYTGRSPEKPKFEHFNYIEKAEYWALIWGSAVMVLTGFFLTFENFTLSFLPKWLVDVFLTIHFYEAILATLAILVWHFYWTIFNPEVYPMNWSWLAGKTSQESEREEPK